MNVPNPHNPPETEALEHHERVIVKELPKALASDLMRQWNDAVEQFDYATNFDYDRCSESEILGLAWLPRVPRDLAERLAHLNILLTLNPNP